MAKLYKIKDWAEHYENNRTKDMKDMRWVPIPNRHDGDGYCQMVEGPNGAAMIGAWLACVQVASKCDPRGTLLRSSRTPHNATSLARITRLSDRDIQNMIDRACSPSIQWMQVEEIQDVINQTAEKPHPPAEKPQKPARNGMELNGMELKEGNGTSLPPESAASGWDPPDVEAQEAPQMPATAPVAAEPTATPSNPPATKLPPRKRAPDPIWDTVAELFFGGTVAPPDYTHVGKIVKAMKEHGAIPAEIRRRRDLYLFRWPNVSCTADALLKHWSHLGAPDPPKVFKNAFTGDIFQEPRK